MASTPPESRRPAVLTQHAQWERTTHDQWANQSGRLGMEDNGQKLGKHVGLLSSQTAHHSVTVSVATT